MRLTWDASKYRWSRHLDRARRLCWGERNNVSAEIDGRAIVSRTLARGHDADQVRGCAYSSVQVVFVSRGGYTTESDITSWHYRQGF